MKPTAIVVAIATGIALMLGLWLGYRAGAPKTTVEVTSQTILQRIADQYFVVTKTVVLDQESTITVDRGSAWSNFWWGQTISAEGLVRADVGVDLSALSESDVRIDDVGKRVSITLPQATILDASQYGDIEVTTKSGVLKYLLDNDPNDDFNQAKERLVEDARAAVEQDTTLFAQAREDAAKLVTLIVEPMGYSVEIQ